VLLAAAGFLRPHGLPPWLQQPISAFPYIVLAFGVIFGWYLSSVRMMLCLLIMILAERAVTMFPAIDQSMSMDRTIFAATALLLPLNLLAFSIVKGDSVSAVRGIMRVLLVLIQPFLVLWLCYPEQQDIAESLQKTYVEWFPAQWTTVPQLAVLAFIMAAGMHVTRFIVYRDPFDAGSIWTLAAIFLAYHGGQFGWQPTQFFAAGGLILFLSLIQSTHRRTYQDELTGIAGRLAYEEAIRRAGKEFSLAILAVDQLKAYAGAHGRAVADQVLKLIAPKVEAACQGRNVYRVSGEELTLVFPRRTAVETLIILETVRKTIEASSFVLGNRDRVIEDLREKRNPHARALPLSVSIGLAERANEDVSVSLVVRAAYRALYEAKSAGGNVIKRGIVVLDTPRRSYGSSGRIVADGEY
ncbi:MAG TPA: GGDEF domain-containing protein, partial [Nitrospira sp.]